MEGQYTTIVADLSGLTGSYEMSLCNIGIMGTKYVRTIGSYQAPDSLVYISTESAPSTKISHIVADSSYSISNTLEITLRQKVGSELPFVSFSTRSSGYQSFIVDPALNNIGEGPHKLYLESYDAKSGGIDSTLRTDEIEITIRDCSSHEDSFGDPGINTLTTTIIILEYGPKIDFPIAADPLN